MSNLNESLHELQAVIMEIDQSIANEDWSVANFEDSVAARIYMADLKAQLILLLSDLDGKIIESMGEDYTRNIQGFEVEKKKGASRKKWRHDEIADTLTKRLIDLSISEDGEITITPAEAIQKILEYGHVDYWRAGKVAELDVNPDAFCDVEEGKTSLVIRKR